MTYLKVPRGRVLHVEATRTGAHVFTKCRRAYEVGEVQSQDYPHGADVCKRCKP